MSKSVYSVFTYFTVSAIFETQDGPSHKYYGKPTNSLPWRLIEKELQSICTLVTKFNPWTTLWTGMS